MNDSSEPSPACDPLIGARLGEYEILRQIGLGGMGAVYEGRHPLIGKRVSVKVLHPHLCADPEAEQRFLDEARAVNEVRHRGIVDIFAFGQLANGAHYFVMELLEGVGFERVVEDCGAISPAETLTYLAEILDALGAAHRAGIVHCDLKPSNLFLVDSGRGRSFVKLLDFGIARLKRDGTSPVSPAQGPLMGTPAYMSPEQVKREEMTGSSDLYSLGMVVFEMLTGRPAFADADPLKVLWNHVTTEVPPPSSRRPGLAPELDALVEWMVRKSPADRPASCEVLLDHVVALKAALAEAEPSLPRQTPLPTLAAFSRTERHPGLPRVTRPPRRNTGRWSGLAAFSFSLLALGAFECGPALARPAAVEGVFEFAALPTLDFPVTVDEPIAETPVAVSSPPTAFNKAPALARIGRAGARLRAAEIKRGSADAVNRQFLKVIKDDLLKATAAAQVKELLRQISQLDESIAAL